MEFCQRNACDCITTYPHPRLAVETVIGGPRRHRHPSLVGTPPSKTHRTPTATEAHQPWWTAPKTATLKEGPPRRTALINACIP